MAAFCIRADVAMRRTALFLSTRRRNHSQSLWEELLGRKIEPAAAKKLEDAFLEYRVRKSVPSWLPFLPNRSFWIPSSEDTIKDLQVLAERIKVSKPSQPEQSGLYRSPSNWSSDKGSIAAISKVAEWSLIQQTDKLLSGAASGQVSGTKDTLFKAAAERGTIIEVTLGGDDEDDDDNSSDSEEELEVIDETKQKGS